MLIILFAALLFALASASREYTRVYLPNVKSLAFSKYGETLSRIGKRYRQLIPDDNNKYPDIARNIDLIVCENVSTDGTVEWKCRTDDLPLGYKLKNVIVSCEGWDGPNDNYVLEGSCFVKYGVKYSRSRNHTHIISEDETIVNPHTTKTIYNEYRRNGTVHTKEYEKQEKPRGFNKVFNFFSDGRLVGEKVKYINISNEIYDTLSSIVMLIMIILLIVFIYHIISKCEKRNPRGDYDVHVGREPVVVEKHIYHNRRIPVTSKRVIITEPNCAEKVVFTNITQTVPEVVAKDKMVITNKTDKPVIVNTVTGKVREVESDSDDEGVAATSCVR